MSLNATLDRLKAEQIRNNAKFKEGDKVIVNRSYISEVYKIDPAYPDYPFVVQKEDGCMGHFMESDLEPYEPKEEVKHLHPLVQDWAKDIFFQRMLKDINPGLSEGKIDAMIERSVMIATKLYNKLYK